MCGSSVYQLLMSCGIDPAVGSGGALKLGWEMEDKDVITIIALMLGFVILAAFTLWCALAHLLRMKPMLSPPGWEAISEDTMAALAAPTRAGSGY